MNHLLGSLILIFCISTAFGQTDLQGQEIVQEDWIVLKENEYQLKYPTNWILDTSQQMGTSFILYDELSNESDDFRENVNLIIQDLSQFDLTLDQYVELSENQVRTLVTKSEIHISNREKARGFEFHKIVYSGKQGVYDLKFEQYYWVIDEKAFVLTLTCERTEFDNYQRIGEQILDSFKLLKN